MVFFLGTLKLILYGIPISTVGAAIVVLATSQDAIGQYLIDVGPARKRHLIAHLKFGYNTAVRFLGERGFKPTLWKYLLFYSVILPPLAILFLPAELIRGMKLSPEELIERQWMFLVGFEVWLWGNVICDTMAFVIMRKIVKKLLVQLENGLGSVFAIGTAAAKSVLVSGAFLFLTAYTTAIAYVLELKKGDWDDEILKLSPFAVADIMVADFAVLGETLAIPPHLVVAASSYVLSICLFASFFALALVTRLVTLPVISRIGNRVVEGDTTKAHIIGVLAIAGGICIGVLNIL